MHSRMANIAKNRAAGFPLFCLPTQLFQLIETGAALPNMCQKYSELRIAGMSRESREHIVAWAVDSLGIGKVPMHDPFESVYQIFFFSHECSFSFERVVVVSFSAESHGPGSLSRRNLGCFDQS